MKRFVLLISFLLIFGSPFFAQDIQHQVGVVNIEVPVRVFKGSTFIDDLAIDDFEIYEDNILQKIEAVYLIKKNSKYLINAIVINIDGQWTYLGKSIPMAYINSPF